MLGNCSRLEAVAKVTIFFCRLPTISIPGSTLKTLTVFPTHPPIQRGSVPKAAVGLSPRQQRLMRMSGARYGTAEARTYEEIYRTHIHRTYIYMYVYLHVYMYVCACTCIYIYIYV